MKSIKERARELWGNLPVIQENYIAVIEKALEEQKAIDEDAINAVVEEQVLRAIEKQKTRTLNKVYNIITEELGESCGTALIKVIQKAIEK